MASNYPSAPTPAAGEGSGARSGTGTGSGSPPRRVSSPVLAARDVELETLREAAARPPAFVIIEGEAGVGKTRLIGELSRELGERGQRVLTGHCPALQDPFPLGPVVEAVRSLGPDLGTLNLSPLAGALSPVFPELAGHLPPAPEALGDPAMERQRLWRAIVEVLGSVGPALLVLEDLHWSDDATPQFMAFLATQQPAGLTVALTARTEGPAPDSRLGALAARLPASTLVVRLRVGPLAPRDVKVMVGAILEADEISDEFANYLHERTAGIPLAVEEVLRLLMDRKDIVRMRGQWGRRALDEVEVPAAIRDSILERVGRLAPDARAMTEAAAVVAEPGPEHLLVAVAGLPADQAAAGLASAVDAGIVNAGADGYACRHALAADAVYNAITPPRRRSLHRRAAEALEREVEPNGMGGPAAASTRTGNQAARLAHHWKAAGDERRWVRFSEEAAALAMALGDPATAAALLLDAVCAPDIDGSTRGRLALALTDAAVGSLGHTEAIGVVEGVLRSEELPVRLRTLIRIGLGSMWHQAGDASRARAEYAAAAADVEDDEELLAPVSIALAVPWVLEGDIEEHMRWLDQAVRSAGALTEEARAGVMGDRAAILLAVGDGLGWEAIPPPTPPGAGRPDPADRARLCTNLAINAFHLGHDRRAAELVEEGLSVFRETVEPRMAPALHAAALLLAWSAGRWDDIDAMAREVFDRRPDVPSIVQTETVLAQLALARGETDAAEVGAAKAMDRAGRCGAIPTMGMAAAVLARVRLARGDVEAARAAVELPLEVLAAKGVWAWAGGLLPAAAEALSEAGAAGEAGEWCRRAGLGLTGRDAPTARAGLISAQARLDEANGREVDAAAGFARAEAAWHRIGRPYDAALAGEGRARCLLRAGATGDAARQAEAELAGQRALLALKDLGAGWDEARLRRLLRAHDVSVPYQGRTGRRSYGGELSPREKEVVDLAAGGLTSSRIAARLFLSPRTVDHHLARAMRKLGVASRRELVAARDAMVSRPDGP